MKHLYHMALSLALLLLPTLASEPSKHTFKKALEKEHVTRMQSLLAPHDIDVNLQDEFGSTALMVAIDKYHLALAEQLLSYKDINVNLQNVHGYTALMFSIWSDYVVVTEKLLKRHDIDVNLQDKLGSTVLMHAIRCNHLTLAEELIKRDDVKINLQDNDGYTALMITIFKEYIPLAEQLLQHKEVNVNLQDIYAGYTALMLAICRNATPLAEQLIRHKNINVNLQDKDGNTALLLAICRDRMIMVEKLLAHKNINVNLQDKDGYTALMITTAQNHIPTVELLLGCEDVDVNLRNKYGDTALIIAICRDHLTLAELLLKRHDLDVNLQYEEGDTALMLAINTKNITLVDLLLNRDDIDVNLEDCNKKNALAHIGNRHIDLNNLQRDQHWYISLVKNTQAPSLDRKHALLQPTYLQALYMQKSCHQAIKQYIDILLINKLGNELEEKQRTLFYQSCLIGYESKNTHYSIEAKGIAYHNPSSHYQPVLDEDLTKLLTGYLRGVNMKGVSYSSDWVHLITCYLWANNQFAMEHKLTTMSLQAIHFWHKHHSPYTEFLDAANHTQERALFKIMNQKGQCEAVATKYLARGLKQVGIIQEEKEVFEKSVNWFTSIIVAGVKMLNHQLATS